MTPDELRALADEYEAFSSSAADWLEKHGADLTRLCAELGEVLSDLDYRTSAIFNADGSLDHLELAKLHASVVVPSGTSRYRAALAQLAELEAK